MDRVILHSDCNNFYASVECMLDSSLRGKCVAVGGSEDDVAATDTNADLMQKIAQNGTMFQQLMALQQQVAMMSQAMGMPVAPVVGAPALGGAVAPNAVEDNSVLGGDSEKSAEPKNTKQARERVANATDPT